MKDNQDLFAGNLDYKKIFYRLLSFKKLYIALVLILLVLALLFNRFSNVRYENKSTIYLSSSENQNLLSSPNDFMQSFGMLDNQKIIDNELEILQSFSLVKRVVNEMDLKVTYFSTKNSGLADLFYSTPFTRKVEHYNDSPIRVVLDPSVPQATYLDFKVTFLNENEYMLESRDRKFPCIIISMIRL